MERFAWRVPNPGAPLVDLATAKAHLRVQHTAEDALITTQVAAAERYCSDGSGHVFTPVTGAVLLLDCWPSGGEAIHVPRWPVTNVTKISYLPADGSAAVTVPAEDYHLALEGRPSRILPASGKTWPTADLVPAEGIELEVDAGYDAGACPDTYTEAVLALVTTMYEQRASVVTGTIVAEVEAVLARLLDQDRLYVY